MASSQTHFVSREEYRAKKALDEARKAGTAPAEVDENGKEINPHMPQYITQAPWYLNPTAPSLKHHMLQKQNHKLSLDQWYKRGERKDEIVTKYRKGACENCGAMTHKTKDCCERPRKVGAKFTQKDIASDEIIQEFQLDYDAKRDRWNGYDPEMYSEVIKEYEKYDEARKQKKQEDLVGNAANSENESQDEDFKEKDFDNAGTAASRDPRTKTTTRDLRIREDTAKYLLNLEENSAYYDAKSRSMRENPNPFAAPDKQTFKGDNYVRLSGDTLSLLAQERFAWDAVEKETTELNTVALPTATELMFKKAKEKMEKAISEKNDSLLMKYGGKEHLNPQYDVVLGQTERYVEYTRDGKIKPNKEKTTGKSRYEEDIYINDHTSVWGSWWNKELGWGFACCHSTVKNSMCLGEKGRKIALLREYKIIKEREEQFKKLEETLKEDNNHTENKDDIKLTRTQSTGNNNYPSVNVPKDEIILNKDSGVKESNNALKQPKNNLEETTKKTTNNSNSSSSSSSDSSSGSSSDSDSDSGSDSSLSNSKHESSESEMSNNSDYNRKVKKDHRVSSQSKHDKVNKKRDIKQKKHEKEIKSKHKPYQKDSVQFNEDKLRKALKEEDKRKKEFEEQKDDRKRKYNSLHSNNIQITPEEMEAYRLKKTKFDDPMKDMIN